MNHQENKKLKAFVLAAGFGSRLKELTKTTPKPLLPFMNQPMLFHILDQIEKTKIEEVCINAHYKWELIKEAIEKYKGKLKIHLSVEKEILGTGGALAAVNKWREEADLLVINSDIVHAFDLSGIISKHYKEKKPVTLALTQKPHINEQKIWCYKNKVISLEKQTEQEQTPHGFACIHMISKKVLDGLPTSKNYSIIPIYKKLLKQQEEISAYISKNFWVDIGSPEKYLQSHLDFAKKMKTNEQINHPAFWDINSALKGFNKTITFLSQTYPQLFIKKSGTIT